MPTTDDYGQGVNIAALTDAPDASTLARDIANAIAPRSVMRFTSASNRNATLASPVAGMTAWIGTEGLLTVYDGTAWQEVIRGTLGWQDVALTSGYEAYGGNTVGPRVRRVGPIVYLEGRLKKTSGDIPASDSLTLGTVPASYRPVGHYAEAAVTTSNAGTGTPLGRAEIWHTDGSIKYWSDRSTSFVGFSAWWFVT